MCSARSDPNLNEVISFVIHQDSSDREVRVSYRLSLLTQGCINRPRIGEDFSSETSLPSFPHIGNVGITRKTMESTAELILCGS